MGCSPTQYRPIDGNVAIRRKDDHRERSKSEKFALIQNTEEDEAVSAFFDGPCATEERVRVWKQEGLRFI